ncbi:MAG: DUF3465 domain-containing protein [Candidatus Eremiobacteraeota bacterium]|nr:DUF3465 domain-containing protein [Candidatus Eremiobacteraeota bacterium]
MRSTVAGLSLTALVFAVGCAPATGDAANGAIYDAWRGGNSHLEVTASGTVSRILGTRLGRSGEHEGFLLHLSGAAGRGLTVRVEDNVDLTGPIPLSPGDGATVRGEYIYDPRGGLIHYTHRDPRGRHDAGYVQVGGRLYQ